MADVDDKAIVTKAQAIEHGLKWYFTGKPCKYGHISKRRVHDRWCHDCTNASRRRKYKKNFHVIKEQGRKSYIKHREKSLIGFKKYWEDNREELRRKKREHYQKNKEKIRKKINAYRVNNKQKVRTWGANRLAKKKGAEGNFGPDDIKKLYHLQKGKCAICFCSLRNGFEIDHIKPLSRNGSNWPDNLQLLCKKDNSSKHAMDNIEYAKRIGRLL